MNKEDLNFKDWQEEIKDSLGTSEWLTVYAPKQAIADTTTSEYFSALVLSNKIGKCLEIPEWEIVVGQDKPGFVTYGTGDKKTTKYFRFIKEGVESLVYVRRSADKKQSSVELSEEFRMYFNLFPKNIKGDDLVYVQVGVDGAEEEVAKIVDSVVQVKQAFMQDFLAAKKMHLAIYFRGLRNSEKELRELDQRPQDKVKKNDRYIYHVVVKSVETENTKSQGSIYGKKLIAGLKKL